MIKKAVKKIQDKFFAGIFLLLFLLSPNLLLLHADDYSSTNFIVRDPVITVSGGRSTASSFEFFSSVGQTAPGESTSSNFGYKAGFLYFDEETTSTPSSGGSVSGGSTASPPSNIIFSGKAYPGATVVLLKDAQIFKTVIADNEANFSIEASGTNSVSYIFSLYAKDYTGKASRLLLFPLMLRPDGITTIENIVIPPTIQKDKKEAQKGQSINFFGQSIQNASITINIETPTEIFSVTTISDAGGKYTYSLDTSLLELGEYQALATVRFQDTTSKSSSVDFTIGDEDILEEPTTCPLRADLNSDCAVNLVDFSILIYWFDRAGVPSKIDLDGNGKADLVDFSIMAYHWTG